MAQHRPDRDLHFGQIGTGILPIPAFLSVPAARKVPANRFEGMPRMRFGLFGGARTKRTVGLADSQGYETFIEYIQEAERLDYQSLFMVEHHFTGQGQVSASLTLLAYLAA